MTNLEKWAKNNGIDLDAGVPYVVGYWCRVAGIPLSQEATANSFDKTERAEAKTGWREADDELKFEASQQRGKRVKSRRAAK
jgi:hypothetical protein